MVTRCEFDAHYQIGSRIEDALEELRGLAQWKSDSAVVPDWMNAARGSKSYMRVAKLIHEIEELEIAMVRAVREKWYLNSKQEFAKRMPKQIEEVYLRHDVFQQTLRRYTFSPILDRTMFAPTWNLSMYSARVPGEFLLKRRFHAERKSVRSKDFQDNDQTELIVGEADIVLRILNLAAASELERLKQCQHCSKWLYAERSHQKFCLGAVCRNAFYSRSPKCKKYRKEYMRRRRAEMSHP